jgi:hypothetical protein
VGLRNAVLAVLGFGIVLGVALTVFRLPQPWFVMAAYCALGAVAILVERGRYRPVLSASHFEPSAERYRDPVTGQTIQVFVDAGTGQRDYRPEPIDP